MRRAVKGISLILAAVFMMTALTSCGIFNFDFGGGEEEKEGPKHTGHYLVELYEPEVISKGVTIKKGTNDDGWGTRDFVYMNDEKQYNGALFTTNADGGDFLRSANDCTLTYKIDSTQYKTLCFFAGTAEDKLTNWQIDDSGALKVSFDGREVYEEMYFALDAPRYVSLDVSGVSEITFYIDGSYYRRSLAVMEITLWEDSNHSIEKKYDKATKEEDFLDNTFFMYGGDSDYLLEPNDATCTVNNEVISKGITFRPIGTTTSESPIIYAINTYGRYRYLHFNLGHAKESTYDGAVYVRVKVDGTVKDVIRISDEELPKDITIELNYGKIVKFELFGDFEDNTRTNSFYFGGYAIYHMTGSPNSEFPSKGSTTEYSGSYKLISEVGEPNNFVNAYDKKESVLLGKTKYSGIQIGGILYSEGLIMKSIFNMLTTTSEQMPAKADFDIKGQFKYLTFKVGRKDKSALANDTLNIYVDGELKKSLVLDSYASITECKVDLNYGRLLTIELVGASDTYRGTYGIVDMAVHTGEEIKELAFNHIPNNKKAAQESYPENTTLKLMEDIVCYESFSKANEQDLYTDARSDDCEYRPNTGRHFTAGGVVHSAGFVLQSGTYYSLGGSGAIGMVLAGFYFGIFAGQDLNCGSLAAFNLQGSFKHLSFKVAPLDGKKSKTEELLLIADGKIIKTISLTQTEQTIDVDITGVKNLVFYLSYTDSSSEAFGFYDLVVNN